MKCVYSKAEKIKIFGLKIFEKWTHYSEYSNEDDTDDDDFNIDLITRINKYDRNHE